MSEALGLVSVEDAAGRILTGMDGDLDGLHETIEERQPEPPQPPDESIRNDKGQFTSATEPAKKVTRGRKRFDELTGEREAANRRAEAAEKERDELRAQLEAARRVPAPQPVQQAAQPVQPAEPPARKKIEYPDELKTFDAYLAKNPGAEYEDFTDARVDFRVAQTQPTIDLDARIRERIEADRASRTFQERYNESATRAREALADFDAVLNAPHTNAIWPADKLRAIAMQDDPARVQYELAKDPERFERLRNADLVTFGIELAKLMPAAAVASPASTARTMTPLPPAPYQPVQGGGKTTVSSSASLAEASDSDYDRSGYRERRAQERGVKSRW